MDIYNNKNAIKLLLFLFAATIGIGTLIYTESFLKELRAEEIKKAKIYVEATNLAQSTTDDETLNLVIKIIEGNNTIPVIVVNEEGEVDTHRNLDPEKSKNPEYIKKQIEIMAESNDPIEISYYGDRKVYIYFKESLLLTKLRVYPIILLGVIAIFIVIAYLLFSSSRRSEQNRVWTGMAKETAHQIGTPLSSIMGWIEILRTQNADEMALTEMEKDVSRLQMITDRFSKIGSIPQMTEESIYETVQTSFNYLESRVSKKIDTSLESSIDKDLKLLVNTQLLSWVIENLIRNAIDAIEGPGFVKLELTDQGKNIRLDVIDSGKGVPKAQQSAVFRPGFTTKKRGWGLGLSLAKRIVEDYHKGKITIAQSELGKGTIFRVMLPKTN
jgi:two-component system, sporulation sensor kinase D